MSVGVVQALKSFANFALRLADAIMISPPTHLVPGATACHGPPTSLNLKASGEQVKTEPEAAAAAEGAAEGSAKIVAVPGTAAAAGLGEATGATEDCTAGEAACAFEPESEPEEALFTPHFGPVGGPSLAVGAFSSEAPASGNWTSVDSVVVQSVAGMLATNMAGNVASRARSSNSAVSL